MATPFQQQRRINSDPRFNRGVGLAPPPRILPTQNPAGKQPFQSPPFDPTGGVQSQTGVAQLPTPGQPQVMQTAILIF